MKFTLINGTPNNHSPAFETYLEQLNTCLTASGHQVTHLRLSELDLRKCNGCWGCWVKHPGECFSPDDSARICQAALHSDFTLWASPLRMGFPSALLKTAIDKSIPLIHPYFAVVHGEVHHQPRYGRYPRLGLLVELEPASSDTDLQLVTEIFSRTALNMKSRLEFGLDTSEPVEALAQRITSAPARLPRLPRRPRPTTGVQISPPNSLTVFNGSPRGRKGNTPIFLNQFIQGFSASSPDHRAEFFNLNRTRETASFVEAFAQAECVWLGTPLYTDALPGLVKDFIEQLEPLAGRAANPPLGFLVQCGFPETGHIRYIERYLERLANRLGSPYLGTIAKGNSEGTRMMSENMNRKTFTTLKQLGQNLGRNGRLDPALLQKLSRPEHIPAYLAPFLHFAIKLPVVNYYWDMLLKQNGAHEKRFARPYEEEVGG